MIPFLQSKNIAELPDELLDFCERRNLNGLCLLSTVCFLSRALTGATTEVPVELERVFTRYYSYLLAYAAWIGVKNDKLKIQFPVSSGLLAIKELPASPFHSGSASYDVSQLLHSYYGNLDNLIVASKYFGRFETDVPPVNLGNRIKEGLRTFTSTWIRWGLDDQKYAGFLGSINEKLHGPGMLFYDEETPALREFWNFALIGVVVAKDCEWSFDDEIMKWPLVSGLLSHATNLIRGHVLNTNFPNGLDR